jgi:hypothetical protein
MIKNIYYIIRHRATGEIMPQMKRGRGYTHWNPNNPNKDMGRIVELCTPRLLTSAKQARRCIDAWAMLPNATNDYDGDLKIGPDDGRKNEDLEIVGVELRER